MDVVKKASSRGIAVNLLSYAAPSNGGKSTIIVMRVFTVLMHTVSLTAGTELAESSIGYQLLCKKSDY